MPASAGAISRGWCEGDSLWYEVIGGGEATGLCGSGLLDLAACLTELGYISPDGRLFGDEDENGRAVFPLTEHVVLTAGDVRQLQLAKAAVAAGIRILLEDSGVSYDEIDTLYLAGGFGTRLNPKSAAALGMLPEELQPDYEDVLQPVDEDVEALVKAADKLSAYIKCVEELKAGNDEFKKAAEQTAAALDSYDLPELDYFREHFLKSFELTLDEME
jgi:hypothetical protein